MSQTTRHFGSLATDWFSLRFLSVTDITKRRVRNGELTGSQFLDFAGFSALLSVTVVHRGNGSLTVQATNDVTGGSISQQVVPGDFVRLTKIRASSGMTLIAGSAEATKYTLIVEGT